MPQQSKKPRLKAMLLEDADVSESFVWGKAKIRVGNKGTAEDYIEDRIFISGNDNKKVAVKGTIFLVEKARKKTAKKEPYYRVVGVESAEGEVTTAINQGNDKPSSRGGKWIPSYLPPTVEQMTKRAEDIVTALHASTVLTEAYEVCPQGMVELANIMFERSFRPVQAHTDAASSSVAISSVKDESKKPDTNTEGKEAESTPEEDTTSETPEEEAPKTTPKKTTASKSSTKRKTAQKKTTPAKSKAKAKATAKKQEPPSEESNNEEDFS